MIARNRNVKNKEVSPVRKESHFSNGVKTLLQLRVALAQFNASVGDIEGNIKKMCRFYSQAVEAGADVVVFPEMSVCGYPPEDLLL